MSTIQVGRVGRSDDANQELKVNGLKNVCKNLSTERDETISTVMFNLEQIKRIHDQLGKRATLLQYLRAVKAIGVELHWVGTINTFSKTNQLADCLKGLGRFSSNGEFWGLSGKCSL